MYFYDFRGDKESKPNTEPVISKCVEFQYIDALSLNLADKFNLNILCSIPKRECNKTQKCDWVKYFLKEDENFMVEVINDSVELVKYTKVKVLWKIVQEKLYPMNTLTNESWKVNTQEQCKFCMDLY